MKKKLLLSSMMAFAVMSAIHAGTSRVRNLTPQQELELIRETSTTFTKFKTAIQNGKPKEEVQGLSRDLARQVTTLVKGYAGGTSKIINEQTKASDADKALNAQQIKKLEDAWKKADTAAKEAKKNDKVKPEELKRLQQEAADAKKAYDTRKTQYIFKGELKTIVRI